MAGGYGEKADRVYCEKMVNLASTLKDGQKFTSLLQVIPPRY